MLQVNKLSIIKIQEDRPLIKHLSFIINPNDHIALIGEEGNGKSTLLKYLVGLPLDGFEITGTKHLDQPIGYLEQDIRGRWGNINVVDYFLLDNPLGVIDDYNLLAKIPYLLEKSHFPKTSYDENKLIKDYSGGEILRLALLKLELHDYKTLLLDEPSNDLDLEGIALLKEFIKKVKVPLLFVSHDEALLKECATGILHLEQIRRKSAMKATFARISYEEYETRRVETFTKTNQVIAKKEAQLKDKQERWDKIYQEVKYAQDQCVRDPITGRLLKKKMKTLLSTKKHLEKEEDDIPDKLEDDPFLKLEFPSSVMVPSNKRILEFHGPLKRDHLTLIPNLDLVMVGPIKIALIGPNGIGKSTLLENLYNANKNREDIKLGFMPQNYEELFPNDGTILSFLCPGGNKDAITKTRLYLGSLRYTSEEMLYPLSSLSGGQKAKLFLLKMVLEEKNVLLLDEPTRNLSPFSRKMLDSLLATYKGTVLIITHDVNFIKQMNFQVLALSKEGLKQTTL